MKSKFLYTLLFAVALLSGCSQIDDNERFAEISTETNSDKGNNETPDNTEKKDSTETKTDSTSTQKDPNTGKKDSTNVDPNTSDDQPLTNKAVKRNILVEDFTGQDCPSCPRAHRYIADVLAAFGHDRVIPVAIHGGRYAIKQEDNPHGLSNQASRYYHSERYQQISGSPNLFVNRASSPLSTDGLLSGVVRQLLNEETPLSLQLEAKYTDNDNRLRVNIVAKTAEKIQGKMYVWVLESGIVAPQSNNGRYQYTYVHDHVLRAVMNGNAGEDVTVTPDKTFTVSKDIACLWSQPKNLSVVVFVCNDKGVVQVASAPFMK